MTWRSRPPATIDLRPLCHRERALVRAINRRRPRSHRRWRVFWRWDVLGPFAAPEPVRVLIGGRWRG